MQIEVQRVIQFVSSWIVASSAEEKVSQSDVFCCENTAVTVATITGHGNGHNEGWECSSVGRAWDRHTANAGSIPGATRVFLPESTFSADSLTVSLHPRVQPHALTSVRTLKIL